MLDSLPGAVVCVDRDYRVRFANAAASQWLETSPHLVHGRHVRDLLGEERWEQSRQECEAAVRGEEQTVLRTLLTSDGGLRYTQTQLVPRWAGSDVVGFDVVSADITALVEAEQREHELAAEKALVEDRSRIAADLHDRAVQMLFGAGLDLQGVQRRLPEPDDRVQSCLEAIDGAIRELRTSIFHLSRNEGPASLVPALSRIVDHAATWVGFRPTLVVEGDPGRLSDELAEELVTVAREAVSNVVKHAEASAAWVHLEISADRVALLVLDDGKGPGASTRRSGTGNMADRARRLGGSCSIEPWDPAGTCVVWQAPLQDPSIPSPRTRIGDAEVTGVPTR